MIRKVCILFLIAGLLGCAGAQNYNEWIKKNIGPDAGFQSATWQESFGPFHNFDATVSGVKVENNMLSIDSITINRVTGTTSGHFHVEGYHRVIP